MVRSRAAHERPRGRAGLQQAYADLQVDLAKIRWERYADGLEMIRLQAMSDGLATHLARMGEELTATRHELATYRAEPVQPDPRIEELAVELASLRATIAVQWDLIADLHARADEAQAQAGVVAANAAEQVAAARAAAEAAYAAVASAQASVPAPPSRPVSTAPHEPSPMIDLADGPGTRPAFASVNALAASVATRPLTPSADASEDEAVRRLRLIREAREG